MTETVVQIVALIILSSISHVVAAALLEEKVDPTLTPREKTSEARLGFAILLLLWAAQGLLVWSIATS